MFKSAKFFLTLFSTSLLLVGCQNKVEETTKPASSTPPSSSAMVQKPQASSTSSTVVASQEETATNSEPSGELGENVSEDSSQDQADDIATDQTKPQTEGERPDLTPFPDQLIGSWEFTPISENFKVILTFNPDGSVLKELIDFESGTSHYRYSTIESSEMVGEGLYRFENIGGDNDVTAGSGLGGYGHFEIGVLINGNGTITNQIWYFDPTQDPATYEYIPKNGPVLTWVE